MYPLSDTVKQIQMESVLVVEEYLVAELVAELVAVLAQEVELEAVLAREVEERLLSQ